MREIIPHESTLKFNEMEYALPSRGGAGLLPSGEKADARRHRKQVARRVLYRSVAAEDAYLSPSYEGETATISVHHEAHLSFRDFFGDIEPIFETRRPPHWQSPIRSSHMTSWALYPRWDDSAQSGGGWTPMRLPEHVPARALRLGGRRAARKQGLRYRRRPHPPAGATGPEPALTSHETVCILNASDEEASIELTLYFSDRDPVEPYRFTVGSNRTGHVWFNDRPGARAPGDRVRLGASLKCRGRGQHSRLDSRQHETP